MSEAAPFAVCASTPNAESRARDLAQGLNCPLAPAGTLARDYTAVRALVLVDDDGLALQLCGRKMPGPVRVDFGSAGMRHRRAAGHNELLGKAVGIARKPRLQVLDATAGLGRDSFVLADLGACVTLCERHPLIAAMLEAGLEAARDSGDPWLQERVARMRLRAGDARLLPQAALEEIDVVYLDPMFPRRNKAAAVKKEMALFQLLLPETEGDELALMQWALRQPVSRVVVKRPLKAPALGEVSPSHSIEGRAVRFDVYVLSALA